MANVGGNNSEQFEIMKKLMLILIFVSTISGCTSIGAMRSWTVQETKDWYKEYYVGQPVQARPVTSQIYYRGSDDKFHYFISRSMDEWVFIKIRRDELAITDERPKWTSNQSSSTNAIGYYPVDPLDNFKRIEQARQG